MKDRIINKKWTKHRSTFLLVGFVVSLFIVFSAFEWAIPMVNAPEEKVAFTPLVDADQVIRTAHRKVKRIPPTKKLAKKIEIKLPPKIVTETVEYELDEMVDEYEPEEDFTGESFIEETKAEGKIEIAKEKEEEIFVIASRMPVFGDCREIEDKVTREACSEKALLNYIYKKVTYPTLAKENGMTGAVYAEIIVGKTGEIQYKIVKSPNKILSQAVEDMLEEMPAWQAGMNNYRPVSVKFTIPVKFELN